MPKTITTELQAFLLGNETFGRADLISIAISNGTILNVVYGTNTDITYNGTTYYASRWGAWERGAFTNSAEYRPSASSMDLTALWQEATASFPNTTATFMQAMAAGVFNGAVVTIQTAYWPGGTDPNGNIVGTMMLNVGQVGNVKKTGRSKAVFELFDMTYMLNRPLPPYQIQSSCRHTLFSPGCGLLQANWQSTAVPLDAASTQLWLSLDLPPRYSGHGYSKGNTILAGGIPYMCSQQGTTAFSAPSLPSKRYSTAYDGTVVWTCMANAYTLGFVTFASGQNTGFSGSVKTMAVSSGLVQLQLIRPMPFAVAAGDTVLLVPGCDKTMATCGLYGNQIHYGGCPFVPNPEQAV